MSYCRRNNASSQQHWEYWQTRPQRPPSVPWVISAIRQLVESSAQSLVHGRPVANWIFYFRGFNESFFHQFATLWELGGNLFCRAEGLLLLSSDTLFEAIPRHSPSVTHSTGWPAWSATHHQSKWSPIFASRLSSERPKAELLAVPCELFDRLTAGGRPIADDRITDLVLRLRYKIWSLQECAVWIRIWIPKSDVSLFFSRLQHIPSGKPNNLNINNSNKIFTFSEHAGQHHRSRRWPIREPPCPAQSLKIRTFVITMPLRTCRHNHPSALNRFS
jgi:hypothetical protein